MAKKETDEIPDLFDDLPEETPQEQIARIARRNWREHLAGVSALDRRIEKLIDQAVKQTLAKGRKLTADDIDGLFRKHPELRAALDRQMEQLNSELTAVIEQGSKEAWLRANTAADETVKAMAANNPKLKELLESGQSKPQNDRALRAFRQREMQGMKLSDRVWKATEGMKLDMERAIEVALAEGVPADKLSQRVRGLLKEPHRLYRRVRDKNGNLRLSQAAQKYHPGTGVYRSSYKNAMRVARTEVNMAYQASDSERWKSSWWVKGIRVSLSNNHTCLDSKGKPAPLTDICDALAGDYPADFKFTGWHPQCRCFATAITCDYADIRDYYRRKRAGEDMTGYTPPGTITEPPEQFKRWLAANSNRLERAEKRGTTPYFIANNAKYANTKAKQSVYPKWEISTSDISKCTLANFKTNGITAEQYYGSPIGRLNLPLLDSKISAIFEEAGVKISSRTLGVNVNGALISWTLAEDKGVMTRLFKRGIDGTTIVEHSHFEIAKQLQGKGLSKKLFRELYEHYKAIGVAKIEVHANIDRGGYTWAKYGFYANDETEADKALFLARRKNHPSLGAAEKLIEDFYKEHSPLTPFPMYKIAALPGGKELLLNADWCGFIDLGNAEQKFIFESYIGL